LNSETRKPERGFSSCFWLYGFEIQPFFFFFLSWFPGFQIDPSSAFAGFRINPSSSHAAAAQSYRMPDTAIKPHVQLRDVEADDLPLFFEHQRDPIAVALVRFRSRDRAAFDQQWAKLLADDSCLKKTIVVLSGVSPDPSTTQVVAGNIGSWSSDGKREIGYWIDRALWGRGIATEAAFLRPS
jgi:hypothetical protein